eukprot:163982-Alexandrium_andersonii.AAC.1
MRADSPRPSLEGWACRVSAPGPPPTPAKAELSEVSTLPHLGIVCRTPGPIRAEAPNMKHLLGF